MAAPPATHPAWTRWWAAWLITAVVTGTVGDILSYVIGGYPATLTSHIRRWIGADPVAWYGRLGAAGIVAFLGWALLHLGFGILNPGGKG